MLFLNSKSCLVKVMCVIFFQLSCPQLLHSADNRTLVDSWTVGRTPTSATERSVQQYLESELSAD